MMNGQLYRTGNIGSSTPSKVVAEFLVIPALGGRLLSAQIGQK